MVLRRKKLLLWFIDLATFEISEYNKAKFVRFDYEFLIEKFSNAIENQRPQDSSCPNGCYIKHNGEKLEKAASFPERDNYGDNAHIKETSMQNIPTYDIQKRNSDILKDSEVKTVQKFKYYNSKIQKNESECNLSSMQQIFSASPIPFPCSIERTPFNPGTYTYMDLQIY